MKILRGIKYKECNGKLVKVEDKTTETVDSPYFIPDDMDPTVHHCDGEVYTSKAAFRKTTRAHGCIEVGNEPLENLKKPPKINQSDPMRDIADAIEILESNGDARDKLMQEVDANSPGYNLFGEE